MYIAKILLRLHWNMNLQVLVSIDNWMHGTLFGAKIHNIHGNILQSSL
jgi:hypothetical protein